MRYKKTFAGASGKRNSLLVDLKLRLTEYLPPRGLGIKFRVPLNSKEGEKFYLYFH